MDIESAGRKMSLKKKGSRRKGKEKKTKRLMDRTGREEKKTT